MLGDVRCKYIPVWRKFSAGLVISPPDTMCLYTAMYVESIRSSVTGPTQWATILPKYYFKVNIPGKITNNRTAPISMATSRHSFCGVLDNYKINTNQFNLKWFIEFMCSKFFMIDWCNENFSFNDNWTLFPVLLKWRPHWSSCASLKQKLWTVI